MTWNEVFCNTFKELRKRISPEVRKQVDLMLPSWPMVDACRADSLNAFQPFIAAGKLSVEDMHQACDRYHLGKTKTGTPIYWMIDDMNTPLDAHIGDRWISQLLKQREPLIANWQVQHCLFGLHLLAHTGAVPSVSPAAIVESESSAIVLSALFPETIWLAYATTSHLSPDLFAPLEGHIVTIYPRTDPTLSNYLFFQDLVSLTLQRYDLDITVSPLLEDNATADQKARCIDLLDYLKESL
jgi:hypothetical protein